METGNSIFQGQPRVPADCNLLIHIRQDGVAALAADSSSNEVVGISSKNWLAENDQLKLVHHFQSYCSEWSLDLDQFSSVQYVLSLPKFALIPDILYEKGSGYSILSNSSRLDTHDHILSDFLRYRDSVLIYAIHNKFYEYLKSSNSDSRIAHNGYAMNALAMKSSGTSDQYILSFSESFAEFLIIRDNKLCFYNQFPHDVPEDLLYFVLFVLEQNRIIAPEIKLEIYSQGNDNVNAYKELLKSYLGSVEELSISKFKAIGHSYSQSQQRAVSNLRALI